MCQASSIDPKLFRTNIAIMSLVQPPVNRRYDARKRRESAARTREAILNAALRLFAEHGYTATPMTAIAEQAGVALDTVYASAGRKPQLARLLIETAISGSSQAIPAEERGYVQAIRAAPDAETKIAIYASAMRMIAGRLTPVLSILQQAAPAEPELAALWREIAERRAANMRLFVTDLAAVAALRMDPGEAADIVWATNAPELYQLLVYQRGWSPARYEHFLADTWRRLLLAGQATLSCPEPPALPPSGGHPAA
jgi:AcrR family transcriptional regulator